MAANLQRSAPRWTAPPAWSGSWIFAIVTFAAAGVAVMLSPNAFAEQLYDRWHVVLLILWLACGSNLIRWAHNAARDFEEQARQLIGAPPSQTEIWGSQVELLSHRKAFWIAGPFVGAGVLIALLVEAPVCWKTCWGVAVAATFYYGAFGLWGAWIVTRGVGELSFAAFNTRRLKLFHADKLAGLGFVVKYADVATLLMLTGALALPMGIFLCEQCLAMKSLLGNALAFIAAALIFAWAAFAISSSLRGRSAVSLAIEKYRVPLLNEIAEQKRLLVEAGGTKDAIELLDIKEQAAASLRSGVFCGAGGWKDLFSLVAAGIALIQFFGEVMDMSSKLVQ